MVKAYSDLKNTTIKIENLQKNHIKVLALTNCAIGKFGQFHRKS